MAVHDRLVLQEGLSTHLGGQVQIADRLGLAVDRVHQRCEHTVSGYSGDCHMEYRVRPEGEGDKLVAENATGLGGRIPISTDGGLSCPGHPGGPTGLAQIWETTLQLRGEAGGRQVPDAKVGLGHMVGGGSVCVVHILQRGT